MRDTLAPLLGGGCLFPFDLPRQGLHKLTPWLIAQQITYVSFSGSLFRTWLKSLADDLHFPALQFIEATGEQLYAQDVLCVAQHLEGDWRIGHSYASTSPELSRRRSSPLHAFRTLMSWRLAVRSTEWR